MDTIEKLTETETTETIETQVKMAGSPGELFTWEFDMSSGMISISPARAGDSCDALLSGISLEDLTGRYVSPHHSTRIRSVIDEILANGFINSRVIKFDRPDGGAGMIRICGKTYDSASGRRLIIGAVQDMTGFRRARCDAEERFRFLDTLAEAMTYPLFYKDADLVYRYCNRAFAENLALAKEDVIGRTINDLLPQDQARVMASQDIETLKRGESTIQQHRMTFDGKPRDLIFCKTPVADAAGHAAGIVGVIYGISDFFQSQQLLNRMEKFKDIIMSVNNAILDKSTLIELFEFIVGEALDGMENADCGCILTIDEHDTVKIAASKGYDPFEWRSYTFHLKDSFQWKLTNGKIDGVMIINDLQSTFDPMITEALLKTADGRIIQSTISAPIIMNGKLYGFIHMDSAVNNIFTDEDRYLMDFLSAQLSNSIDKFNLYENMVYLSNHDPQTDLFNRRYFETTLESAIERARRYEERFLVASFDINGLKTVNDKIGHLAGDLLIRRFSAALKTRFRNSDTVARIGGDEFAAIIYNAQIPEMQSKLDMLKKHFAINPITYNGVSFICSFSFGLSSFPEDGTSYDQLIRQADEMMYTDKQKSLKTERRQHEHQ